MEQHIQLEVALDPLNLRHSLKDNVFSAQIERTTDSPER